MFITQLRTTSPSRDLKDAKGREGLFHFQANLRQNRKEKTRTKGLINGACINMIKEEMRASTSRNYLVILREDRVAMKESEPKTFPDRRGDLLCETGSTLNRTQRNEGDIYKRKKWGGAM